MYNNNNIWYVESSKLWIKRKTYKLFIIFISQYISYHIYFYDDIFCNIFLPNHLIFIPKSVTKHDLNCFSEIKSSLLSNKVIRYIRSVSLLYGRTYNYVGMWSIASHHKTNSACINHHFFHWNINKRAKILTKFFT